MFKYCNEELSDTEGGFVYWSFEHSDVVTVVGFPLFTILPRYVE